MIGVVVSNQRGGVGKTTTAVNFAGYLAARGRRVLLIDADSQGSVATILGLKPKRFLSQFILNRERLSECVTVMSEHLHILASQRSTMDAEAALLGQMAREKALQMLLGPEVDGHYDAVIIDVAPSVTLLQSCGMMFAGNVLIPVAMDLLSLQGAQTSVETVRLLNEFYSTSIRILGFLPTMVNARLQITAMVSSTLSGMAARTGIPVLPAVRVDQSVHRAASQRTMLFDYDPASRAAEDYTLAFDQIIASFETMTNGQAQEA